MTRHKLFSFILVSLISFFVLFPAFSEIIYDSNYDYSLDIPEGFLTNEVSEDNKSFHFIHPNYPVQFIIKIYDDPSFNSSSKTLEYALSKLSASMEIDSFSWNNIQDCSISDFSMTLDKQHSGWAVCVPLQKKSAFLVVMSYCDMDKRQSCNPFIMSILNSICTNSDYYCFPGIIVSYAYPSIGKKNVSLNINGSLINSYIDEVDIDAAQFVVDMEFSVFSLYTKHSLWKEAWQRYYRMIYRDSYGRLSQVSNDIYSKLYSICEKENPSNPELTYAQNILSWVQNFEYKRDNQSSKSSDFTNLPDVICGKGNDCDSRSMLVSVILRAANLESFMLISRDYNHAMTTFENEAPGQKYQVEGTDREFLMGETTAKITWGTIAQDFANRSKWIPVILP